MLTVLDEIHFMKLNLKDILFCSKLYIVQPYWPAENRLEDLCHLGKAFGYWFCTYTFISIPQGF